MAIVTNAYPSYDTTGKTLKEQLADTISNISPYETPFMSAIKKEKAKSTNLAETMQQQINQPTHQQKNNRQKNESLPLLL